MSLIAPYVDGKLQTSTTSSDSLTNSSSGNNNVVNSDTFLTLLVAEMQNQDPLEPTSNTEWVSQYATFTQVEQMGEMRDSMDVLRANSLIGKEVVMKVTSETTGETTYKRGVVDYIVMEDGEALLVIDEEKYSMDDLDSVASEEYFTAFDKYSEFTAMIDALPSLNAIDKSYQNTIGELFDYYNSLTDYEKEYIDKYAAGYVASYKSYIEKMEDYGVTYTVEVEKVTTLDDILEAFNKKMDALMTQLSESAASSSSSNSNNSSTSGSDNTTVAGSSNVGDSTGGSENAEGTAGSTDSTNGAENETASGDTEATADASETSENGETQNATESVTPQEEAENNTASSDEDENSAQEAEEA